MLSRNSLLLTAGFLLFIANSAHAQTKDIRLGDILPEPAAGRATVEVYNDGDVPYRCDVAATGQIASNNGQGPLRAKASSALQTVVIRAGREQTLIFDFTERLAKFRATWNDQTALLVAVDEKDIKLECKPDGQNQQNQQGQGCKLSDGVTMVPVGTVKPATNGQQVQCSPSGQWTYVNNQQVPPGMQQPPMQQPPMQQQNGCMLSNGQMAAPGTVSPSTSGGTVQCVNGGWVTINTGPQGCRLNNGQIAPHGSTAPSTTGGLLQCSNGTWLVINNGGHHHDDHYDDGEYYEENDLLNDVPAILEGVGNIIEQLK
jgi:hypothetical protein